MIIRVTLITGDVRQGRYLQHTAEDLHLYDGLPRKIALRMIEDVVKVPSRPPGVCVADLDEE